MKEQMNGAYLLPIKRVTMMGTDPPPPEIVQDSFQDTGNNYFQKRQEKHNVNPKKWETGDISPITHPASRHWLWKGKLRQSLAQTLNWRNVSEKSDKSEQLKPSGQSMRVRRAKQRVISEDP